LIVSALSVQGSVVGERVFFGEGGENQPDAESPNKVSENKDGAMEI
jgi:hypothetical protein